MSDNTFVYPTDQVVGAIPVGRSTDDAVAALRDAGASDDAVTVHRREDGDDLAPRIGAADGVKETVVHTAQKVLGDEAERLHVLEERLDEGATLVCVRLASDPDDEDGRAEEKRTLGRALRDSGAQDVAFYGRYQIQQLDASST